MSNRVSGAITVPADFFGLTSGSTAWPTAGPAPTFPFGRLSTYGAQQTYWGTLHTANNTINWTALDTLVTAAKAAGVQKGIYGLYRCPTFLATTGADVAGPWGYLGECAHPSDLAQLTYFCTQFAERNISEYDSFFDAVQLFNEPYLSASTTPSNTLYEWSAPAQFIDKLWTAYAALKAADSSLLILSPGMTHYGNITSPLAGLGYLSTINGSTHSTKTGEDCYEGVATHWYGLAPEGPAFTGYCTISGWRGTEVEALRAYQKAITDGLAVNGPVHVTEFAVSANLTGAELDLFLNESTAYRESWIQCFYIDAMLAGVKSVSPWIFGSSGLWDDYLLTDDPGVISGLRKIYNACAGKTIVAPSGITADGGRFLTFSDGSTYTVAAP